MKRVPARVLDFFDRHAIKSFIQSETYQMLSDPQLALYEFSPLVIFDMWESEQITGNPRNSLYLRADEVETLGITQRIVEMYELYHVERPENAFDEIDEIVGQIGV